MKSAELRIGNYLKSEKTEDEYTEVVALESDLIMCEDEAGLLQRNEHLTPIKLTEEWLLKLGFVMELGELTLWHDDFLITKSKHTSDIEVIAHQYEFGAEPLVLPHIKHVHQLQNLYFALCGEELTIKEEIGTTT